MNPDEEISGIADRIADGSAIDWPHDLGAADASGTLEALQAIAAVATLHRRPADADGSDLATAPGSRWGPLTVTAQIGQGRFGQVYLAWDARLQRRVALKLLHAPSAAAAASQSHAIEEARLLARVRHPNVLAVYGAECIDGQIGIWTEFIEGETLEALLQRRGPLPAPEAIAIGVDLCRALTAVHEAGLLHRDIKAQNVMRETGGRIVLMDFGTGHDLHARPISAGDLSGTPLYLAPEVLAGGEAAPASDVYALAVLLFRLLTGEYPVSGRTLADVQTGHGARKALRLADARRELPITLVDAIDRGLAPDRADRHQSAAAFGRALEACETPSPSVSKPNARATWTHPRQLAIVMGAVAIIAVVGFVFSRSGRAAPPANVAATAGWTGVALGFRPGGAVADISADGNVIAYFQNHYTELWTYDTRTRRDQRVSLSNPALAGLWAATLTPDGTTIDVATGAGELWRVSLANLEEPRRLVVAAATAPGWSPDGQHMALVSYDPDARSLEIFDADGTNRRVIDARSRPSTFAGFGYRMKPAANRPSWAPDGRRIAVATLTFEDKGVSAHVTLVDALTGESHDAYDFQQRTRDDPGIMQVAWFDDNHLLVNHQADGDAPYQVSMLDVLSGQLSAVMAPSSLSYRGLSISGDRHVVASTSVETRTEIWGGSGSGSDLVLQIPESAARPRDASFDRDGNLIYTKELSDGPAIFVRTGTGPTARLIARGLNPRPAASGTIVFVDPKSRGLYSTAAAASSVSQIREGSFSASNGGVDVSPDGQDVVFVDGPYQTVWTVPVQGGVAREVSAQTFTGRPRFSHDGARLLYRVRKELAVCTWPACNDARPIHVVVNGPHNWTPDDRAFAFTSRNSGADNIWVQPLDGGPAKQITSFSDDRAIIEFNWSLDGKQLAVTRAVGLLDVAILKRDK